jgi:hypothetical protein
LSQGHEGHHGDIQSCWPTPPIWKAREDLREAERLIAQSDWRGVSSKPLALVVDALRQLAGLEDRAE